MATWIEVGDSETAKTLQRWHAEGAKITDFGVCYVSLAEGGFSYMGNMLRLDHPEKGLHVAVLNGNNCRLWGTERGRMEMPHGGAADAGARDPAPGVMAPWHKLCVWAPVTNGWKPRKCVEFDRLMTMIGGAK